MFSLGLPIKLSYRKDTFLAQTCSAFSRWMKTDRIRAAGQERERSLLRGLFIVPVEGSVVVVVGEVPQLELRVFQGNNLYVTISQAGHLQDTCTGIEGEGGSARFREIIVVKLCIDNVSLSQRTSEDQDISIAHSVFVYPFTQNGCTFHDSVVVLA